MAFQSGGIHGYNQVSHGQLMAALKFKDDAVECLRNVNIPEDELLHIADYGCSEGFNSVVTFSEIFTEFRKSRNSPISITHTDLPQNNWTEVNRLIVESDKSYLNLGNIFYSTIGRSFFNQIFPKESVHFAYSSFAMHYLSTKPHRDEGEYGWAFRNGKAQGYKDMKHLLNIRLEELVAGGYLVMVIFGRENENEDPSFSRFSFHTIKELLDRGEILPEEFKYYVWHSYPYHISEIKEILQEFDSRLDVVKCEYGKDLFPYYSEYIETGDFEVYEKKITDMMRIMMKNALFTCLKRSEEEKIELLNKAIDEVKLSLRNNPQPLYQDYLTVIIMKKS